MAHVVDPALLEAAVDTEVRVPRGEARKAVAALAAALAERRPQAELEPLLAAAAEALLEDDGVRAVAEELGADGADTAAARALAYRAALPVLARSEAVTTRLAELEPLLQQLDDEDRAGYAPVLARVAAPALGLDLQLMKDEGYEFVAIYPPEGSENVDIVGRAATWLVKRMTMESDAPRTAMRRFLAVVAEEVEVELPLCAQLLDELVARRMPLNATKDDAFLSLARGLVEEAVRERGFPW